MHRIAILVFKLQSSPVRFSIYSYGTSSSLLLVGVQDVQKNTAKCCFYFFCAHSPKKTLYRGLMGGHPFLKSSRLFDLFALSCPPLGYGQFREMIGKDRGQRS